jgi:hypothetical protein
MAIDRRTALALPLGLAAASPLDAVENRFTEAGVDARFFEIGNEFGHIGANIDSPGWVPTLAGFLRQAAQG